MPSIFRIFGAVGCAVVLSSNAGAQGLVSQKNIPLAMAKTIAEAAMDKCKELGFKVSVVVEPAEAGSFSIRLTKSVDEVPNVRAV
jgi:hypothetical protein